MKKLRSFAAAALLVGAVGHIGAQEAAAPAENQNEKEDVIVLSPFEVTAESNGYSAATTLAGNRLNTELRDIGNAVTVITSQFLKDIGATDNKTLLQYTTNTEVGGFYGNFAGFGDGSHLDESGRFTNPNSNTRIRGLTSADNTREYFITDIPWEGYNVDGVDLQRGPNSILFGQGSPAGIINTRTKSAGFKDLNEVSFRVGSWGSTRATLDVNKVLLKNELAIRIAAVRNDEQYKQDPAYAEQKRIYGAIRWEPNFLKIGSARTILKASVEFGDIDSNNPRQLPPVDRITPWFNTGTYAGRNVANQQYNFPELNKLTVNPATNEDDNTGRPNTGYDRPSHNGPSGLYIVNGVNYFIPKYASDPNFAAGKFGGTPSEYFQPWVSGSMLGVFGSPAFNFQYNDPTQLTAVNWEPQGTHGINSDGTPNTTTSTVGTRYMRPASISSYSEWARKSRQYYNGLPAWSFGLYKDTSITDPSVFDFYNNLLDGPTKFEWQNFKNLNASLAQTFFHDRAGFELTYNKEHYKSGKVQLLTNDSINIDINRVYSDGSPAGKNGIPWEDGTPNPNLGKPYVGGDGQFGNNERITDREDWRVTGFVDYDFNQNHTNWLSKLMGRHVVTGLLSGDRVVSGNRDFARYSIDDPAYFKKINANYVDDATTRLAWTSQLPFTFIYLGDSLSGASTAAGANIPAPQISPSIVSGKVINFDATWNATGVNPGDIWHDDYYPLPGQVPFTTDGNYRDANGNILLAPTTPGGAGAPGYGTQNQNPLNYVGFREYPINIIDSLTSDENMDRNTRNYLLQKSTLRSRAFNWQGHLWDNAVVATWGVRKDTARSWQRSRNVSQAAKINYQRMSASDVVLPETFDNELQVTSHAWTVVAHLNQLPFFNKIPFVNVSLFYNHSTDFQPAAQRVDIYGESLAAPSGKTKDVGILIETQDGKYSLKVNKYKTASVNASSAGLGGAWFIGSSQAWAGNWVNRFEFNWTNDTVGGAANPADANYTTNTMYNYEPAPGETQAQAATREQNVITAWRAWQASVDPRFYSAWGINLNDHTRSIGATTPNGFAVTEDSSSEGYEIEFNATPTRNWRITLNASKTTAQRNNIGGTNLRAFMAAYTSFLGSGAPGTGGDLRIWWGGAGNETALQQWNTNINSEYNQRKLQEGTNVPELRKWRWNAITNYQFDHGPLKNFNIGGGVRYESSVVIGYEPIAGATASEISFDIADPYRGPSETNYDAWIGYRRKIWRNIDWNIQLNVRNIGVGNELVPITTQPDGTPATYRIKAPQTWAITNTFNF